MAFEFSRNIIDQAYVQTLDITSSTTTAYTPSQDLEQVIGGNIENVVGQIYVPAIASLSDTKTITITLQDSADNSTFADVDPTTSTVVTGAGGAGAAVKDSRFRFPPILRRYYRHKVVVAATSGISGTVTLTSRILF